ncbi:hypothetical protein GETHPA_28400 [Geothrix rubra]|uniref:KTSC domain-containing protein n=1 Tax=Geothrix rubra TaxID=2927977 RepID=A0ABQ5Q9B7_9BACT|nr:hypothetical protein [Geothrix rubra]GLH71307.1 hypothetical protein GETHPA_28400 [Geothrix rubra]
MRRYGDPAGDSRIRAFEFSADGITVEFQDGAIYRYDHANTGLANIQQMKQLALSGKGLNRYIDRYARRNYALRLR